MEFGIRNNSPLQDLITANEIGTTDSICNDINSCLEYVKSLHNIQSMNYVKLLRHRNEAKVSSNINNGEHIAPYYQSDTVDNYDDNNNIDIIVAYGTNATTKKNNHIYFYAKPIISTN